MKNKFILLMVCSIFISFIMMSSVSAFGPHTHNFILDNIGQSEDISSNLIPCYDNGTNLEALRAGAIAPDISVIYYWTEGGKNYKAMHNWNFQQEIQAQATTQDEKCFAYGIAFHLVADSVSHTKLIPLEISRTGVPNWVAHPLTEKKIDSLMVSEHPELMQETKTMLAGFYGSRGEKYISMVEYALGSNSEINVKKELDNLNFAIDGFYEKAYKPKVQDSSLFAIYPYIDSITNFMTPVSNILGSDEIESYVNQANELTSNTFNNWGSRYALSPHGFSELQIADDNATPIVSIIFILTILFFFFFPIFMVIKTKRIKWSLLFLLLIPILVLIIAIIYMWL